MRPTNASTSFGPQRGPQPYQEHDESAHGLVSPLLLGSLHPRRQLEMITKFCALRLATDPGFRRRTSLNWVPTTSRWHAGLLEEASNLTGGFTNGRSEESVNGKRLNRENRVSQVSNNLAVP